VRGRAGAEDESSLPSHARSLRMHQTGAGRRCPRPKTEKEKEDGKVAEAERGKLEGNVGGSSALGTGDGWCGGNSGNAGNVANNTIKERKGEGTWQKK